VNGLKGCRVVGDKGYDSVPCGRWWNARAGKTHEGNAAKLRVELKTKVVTKQSKVLETNS
jgi:DNA mismatch repair protein MutH